jgi:prepilin-type N-terminal cleavage/methylation domain-containing protein
MKRDTISSRGMTLIEVIIALTVLAVGILGLVMSLSSSLVLTDPNREEGIALCVTTTKQARFVAHGV